MKLLGPWDGILCGVSRSVFGEDIIMYVDLYGKKIYWRVVL